MDKARIAQQAAIRRASKVPEQRAFCSKRMCWANGAWPCRWDFYTNWRGFGVGIGTPKTKFNGPDVPEPLFSLFLDLKPFKIISFWGMKRLFWIGDWAWKKELHAG